MTGNSDSNGPLRLAHSIVSGDSIKHVVQEHYDVGKINKCYLIQSGYNDVYIFECIDKSKWIARLSGTRPRGPANTEYEVSLLDHLNASGIGVAKAIRPRTGNACISVELPEGLRSLTVSHYITAKDPKSLEHWTATGAGLAGIHNASESYCGPLSLYRLDLNHLLKSPMSWLLSLPGLDDSLSESLTKLAADIESDFEASGKLSEVVCHGDCHGGNNFIREGSASDLEAIFFDFDDAGPGFQAYDLAVFLWGQLGDDKTLSKKASDNWEAFLKGYESKRELGQADRQAIPVFVRMRHLLWLGEHAGRTEQWGLSAIPLQWLRKQAEMLQNWQQGFRD